MAAASMPRRLNSSGTGYTAITPALVTTSAYTDNTVANGTTYYYVVTASNSSNNESAYSAEVSSASLSAIQSWRQQYFGTTANSGQAADTVDANIDGLANVVEFYLHRNPNGPNDSSTLPVAAMDGSTLTLTYTRSKAAMSEVTGSVVWSDTLAPGSWSGSGVTEKILNDDGVVQKVEASVAPGSTGKRFLRVNVTRP